MSPMRNIFLPPPFHSRFVYYRENMEKLKSGDLYEVARVVKSLLHREHEKGLSTGERKMLRTAKQILISEMVLSTGEDYNAASARHSREAA